MGLSKDYSLFQVQTTAEQMAKHMGMTSYTPVVELADLPEGSVGVTYLNDDKLVYILLDKKQFNTKYYPPVQLLTIIAHGLCHKFLLIHGFKETSQKIKYLIDACAVYVGFGEIMLKGVEVRQISSSGLTIRTHTKSVGYLEKWQIAYLRNAFYDIPISLANRKWFKCFLNVIMAIISIGLIVGLFIIAFEFEN